jgi:SNF2 family DNA or RNA helicase
LGHNVAYNRIRSYSVGKLCVVCIRHDEAIGNGGKVLVFSQFVSYLQLARDILEGLNVKYSYLDGGTRDRGEAVKSFQNDADCRVFLISLKAGGVGLNLTAADYVIHLDPWWNPAVEDQASDRAHRMGQKRPVTVYRLMAENTVEDKIVSLHARKRELAQSLLEGADTPARLDAAAMLALIREDCAKIWVPS